MSPLIIVTWMAMVAVLVGAAVVIFANGNRTRVSRVDRRWATTGLLVLSASIGARLETLVPAGSSGWWNLVSAVGAAAAVVCLLVSLVAPYVRELLTKHSTE